MQATHNKLLWWTASLTLLCLLTAVVPNQNPHIVSNHTLRLEDVGALPKISATRPSEIPLSSMRITYKGLFPLYLTFSNNLPFFLDYAVDTTEDPQLQTVALGLDAGPARFVQGYTFNATYRLSSVFPYYVDDPFPLTPPSLHICDSFKLSPSGKWLAFYAMPLRESPPGQVFHCSLYTVNLSDFEPKRVLEWQTSDGLVLLSHFAPVFVGEDHIVVPMFRKPEQGNGSLRRSLRVLDAASWKLISLDGGSVTEVSGDESLPRELILRRWFESAHPEFVYLGSDPDGRRILYTKGPEYDCPRGEKCTLPQWKYTGDALYIMDAESGESRRIAHYPESTIETARFCIPGTDIIVLVNGRLGNDPFYFGILVYSLDSA